MEPFQRLLAHARARPKMRRPRERGQSMYLKRLGRILSHTHCNRTANRESGRAVRTKVNLQNQPKPIESHTDEKETDHYIRLHYFRFSFRGNPYPKFHSPKAPSFAKFVRDYFATVRWG